MNKIRQNNNKNKMKDHKVSIEHQIEIIQHKGKIPYQSVATILAQKAHVLQAQYQHIKHKLKQLHLTTQQINIILFQHHIHIH